MSSKDKNAGSTASFQKKFGKNTEMDDVENEAELPPPLSYAELQQKLEEAEQKASEATEKANENWDRLLRNQAETKNIQERLRRDVENAHKYGIEKFALDLLPVVDNLERAIESHLSDPSGKGSLLDGVELTLKMFYTTLDKFGIQAVDPKGQPFNPEFHQAVSVAEDPSVKPGSVINVLQKGFILNNRLIRPALVIVAK